MSRDDPTTELFCGSQELVAEPRLSNTSLASYPGDLATAVANLGERPVEVIQLSLTAQKRRAPSRDRRMPPVSVRVPFHREHVDEVLHALHCRWLKRRRVDLPLDQLGSTGRRENGAGCGDLLHPRGEMRGLADRRVVHVQIVADRSDDDLTGVEADTNLQRHADR